MSKARKSIKHTLQVIGEKCELQYPKMARKHAERLQIALDTLDGMAQSKQEKFKVVRELAQEAVDKIDNV